MIPRIAAFLVLVSAFAQAEVDVLSWRYGPTNLGQNLRETVLTPANVRPETFGKLFTHAVEGYVYAQPLTVANVAIPGKGTHNVVIVATEHNSVYAFDADSNAGANRDPLWTVNLGPAAPSRAPDFADFYGPYRDLVPEIGITGTPVIDLKTGTIYLDAFTFEDGKYVHRFHAMDLATGAEKFGGPRVIEASVPGTGAGSVDGVVHFDARRAIQRPALTLVNGIVYLAYAGYADTPPYHGWVLGFRADTLELARVFNVTPNGAAGGIWTGGAGLAVDAESNLYFETGNGDFDAPTGGTSYSDSFLKVATEPQLAVRDYFTPFNQAYLSDKDIDLGSGGVVLLPDQPGPHPHLLVGGGKEGRIYLLDRDHLGGTNTASQDDSNAVQTIPGALGNAMRNGRVGGCFSTPAYFEGVTYWVGNGDVIKAFPLSGGRLASEPSSRGTYAFSFPGSSPAVSANGSRDGIVWVLDPSAPGTLLAYDPKDLAKLLYDSNQTGDRDRLTNGVKFTVPTVANGKVYVGSQSAVSVFGLFPAAEAAPSAPEKLTAHAAASTQIDLAWTAGSDNETMFEIERSSNGRDFRWVNSVGAGVTRASDSGLAAGETFYYRVRAVNSAGASAESKVATAKTLEGSTTPGLVGHWKLDEGSGTVAKDASDFHADGTLHGEVTRLDGQPGFGHALGFHGVGQAIANVTVPDATQLRFAPTDSFTISAWVTSNSPGNKWADIVIKSRDQAPWYGLAIDPTNHWAFVGPEGWVAGPTVTPGWHLITGVQDGGRAGTRRLYVDGVPAGRGARLQGADGPGALWFGNGASVSEPFNGLIDDVRIYNRALPGDEIETLANTTWTSADLGTVGLAGSARVLRNGRFTLRGAGDGIAGRADGFHFVYQRKSGDGELTAQLTDLDAGKGAAVAGVMIRATLDDGSAFAATAVQSAGTVALLTRTKAGTDAVVGKPQPAKTPGWVRLTRRGDVFTSTTSSDGVKWTPLDERKIPMGGDAFWGLLVAAHGGAAKFDHVTLAAPK